MISGDKKSISTREVITATATATTTTTAIINLALSVRLPVGVYFAEESCDFGKNGFLSDRM